MKKANKKTLDSFIQDIIIGIVSDSQPLAGNIVRLAFSLFSFVSDNYIPNENMEDFKKYAKERIISKENK